MAFRVALALSPRCVPQLRLENDLFRPPVLLAKPVASSPTTCAVWHCCSVAAIDR